MNKVKKLTFIDLFAECGGLRNQPNMQMLFQIAKLLKVNPRD